MAFTDLIVKQRAKIFLRLTHPHPQLAVRCTWVMFFHTHIPTRWHDFGACAANQFFIQWDGMTTVYQPSDVYKIFMAFRATRL
jgi:hypothetical protein